MESRTAQLNRIAPRRIRVQAALWVTELHGPDRNAALEAKVKQWIAEDPRHAAAFELATDAWQRSGNLPGHLPLREAVGRKSKEARRVSRPVLAGVAVSMVGLVVAIYLARDNTISTGPGEQRTVALNDGTEVSLNANSRVIVQYDERVRRVALVRGEALFNVVKHQPRPFVVMAGDRKVVAVGTAFVVRRETVSGTGFAVTLIEGRVAVEALSEPDFLPAEGAPDVKLLAPGQRMKFARNKQDAVDSPNLDKVTAWQRGQLIFDDISMQEAAAEFNGYGSRRIVIDDPSVARLRVGGVYRIADPMSFARSMAATYQLRLADDDTTITLSKTESTEVNKISTR
jgi:transmembrane sensor